MEKYVATNDWAKIIGKEGRSELLRFQLQMITRRAALGWTGKDLKEAMQKLGLIRTTPETGSMYWQMADVQDWCRVLGGKLVLSYPGVPVPETEELEMIMQNLEALFDADTLDRYRAVRYLAAARITTGISVKDFAAKTGMSTGAITTWENDTPNPMIPGLMRHAIGLGGIVRLDFEEVELTKGPKGR